MAHRYVTRIERVPPVVLRVEHHALRPGVPGRLQRPIKVDFETAFRRGMALPLHHAVGLVRWNHALALVGGAEHRNIGVLTRSAQWRGQCNAYAGAHRVQKSAAIHFLFSSLSDGRAGLDTIALRRFGNLPSLLGDRTRGLGDFAYALAVDALPFGE